jgi:hypothetical protein
MPTTMRNNIVILLFLSLFGISACSKNSSGSGDLSSNGNHIGQGGSLARYTIVGRYLYTVDANNLRVFDLDAANGPQLVNKQNIGFAIETIFPFKDYLFIGSNSAMYIYTLSNPAQPQLLSETMHINGCDPVVANNDYAFLTIHGGNACRSSINELQIYNIQNIQQPIWIKSVAMTHPLGLALHEQYLYVCDQEKGLYVIDISNPEQPIIKNTLGGEIFLDVIADANTQTLIAMLRDGIALYDMANPVLLPKLSVVK